jgi:fructose-1,6-bisphosphatase/sedoheptulose 1,7-bisphosphatase-like protein
MTSAERPRVADQLPIPTVPKIELQPDIFPEIKIVRNSLLNTTQMVALVAKGQIEEFQPQPLLDANLPDGEKKSRVKMLDNTAAKVTTLDFQNLQFLGYIAGCEGGKERQDYKGEVEIDTLVGLHGNGQHQVDIVMDPIEGSDGAAHNRKGTIAIVSTGTRGGILPTPEGIRKPEIHYMEKLMGPPALDGKISLDMTTEENLQAVIDEFGVNPEDIEVTVLDRPRNRKLIEAIEHFGGIVKLIEYGDLVPSLNAMKDKHEDGKKRLVMGVGGWEEGILAAVGAKALGAVAEGRMAEVWKEDGEEKCEIFPPLLRKNDMVPALQEHSMVLFTAITDIPEFEMEGVNLEQGYAQSMVIDKNGFHKNRYLFDPEEAGKYIRKMAA